MLKGCLKTGLTGIRIEKGFSLVELLVVIAISGTLVVIGVPSIISQMAHLRLTRSTREASTELNAARLKAIAKNTKFKVAFTLYTGTTSDTYRLFTYETGSWQNDTSRTLRSVESGVNISSPSGDFEVEFYPNGTATATTICIENTATTGDNMKITVQGTTGMTTITTGC
ncbi:MAG: prepilin-type N-terminal cleavage/methylation domain-containing protein [Deltaproteobacteria bacterium]|nr:prepilin-type N-terminal cleavage/methylation domain-containing protein [Deltaproteobacteria bacterium]